MTMLSATSVCVCVMTSMSIAVYYDKNILQRQIQKISIKFVAFFIN